MRSRFVPGYVMAAVALVCLRNSLPSEASAVSTPWILRNDTYYDSNSWLRNAIPLVEAAVSAFGDRDVPALIATVDLSTILPPITSTATVTSSYTLDPLEWESINESYVTL